MRFIQGRVYSSMVWKGTRIVLVFGLLSMLLSIPLFIFHGVEEYVTGFYAFDPILFII